MKLKPELEEKIKKMCETECKKNNRGLGYEKCAELCYIATVEVITSPLWRRPPERVLEMFEELEKWAKQKHGSSSIQ